MFNYKIYFLTKFQIFPFKILIFKYLTSFFSKTPTSIFLRLSCCLAVAWFFSTKNSVCNYNKCHTLSSYRASTMRHQTHVPTPTPGSPPPLCICRITFTHLEQISSMVKSKGKTCMVEEPLHVKQLSLSNVCKIGLIVGLCTYQLHTQRTRW
jgi:hypothetical protein